jgi:hypothetical protein
MATYATMDALRRIANDPAAAPAEREYAERKLREYASQPVVVSSGKSNRAIRAAEHTATYVAQQEDIRAAIEAAAEDRRRVSAEAQQNHGIRMAKARIDHATYMVNAQNDLENAELRLAEERARRARRRAALEAEAR